MQRGDRGTPPGLGHSLHRRCNRGYSRQVRRASQPITMIAQQAPPRTQSVAMSNAMRYISGDGTPAELILH
jgi:hypothetical protein